MMAGTDKVDEGHFNVAFCAAYGNGVGVLRKLGYPFVIPRSWPPIIPMAIIINIRQCDRNNKPVVHVGRSRIAFIIRARKRDRLVFDLKRIQIPICARLSSNRLDGEGQILSDANVTLIRKLVVINHSVSIGIAIGFSSSTDLIRNGEVIRRVRCIRNVNRRIARNVVQRIHSVVPSQRGIIDRNPNRISVHIGNGEIHRFARLDGRRTGHQALSIIDSRHVVRDCVLIHVSLIAQYDGLVRAEKRGDTTISINRIIRMLALIRGASARKLDCVIANVGTHEIVHGAIGTGQLLRSVIRNGSAFKALRNIVDIIRVYRLLILIDERNMHIVGVPLHRTNRHRLGNSSLPRGVIGSRLVRGGNLRGLDGDRQAVVHGLGGNRVRTGLVGGHIGVRTVDGVEHAARLEAVVGSHGELDLGLGREIDRILVLGDRLLGAVRVGVLERRVRDLDRYLRGGILLDRGGVILGRTPPP